MILIKSAEELKRMAEACRMVAEVLQALKKIVAIGQSTAEIERAAADEVAKRGGIPAFKGYKGYPSVLCTSVNNQVVHGIPGPRKLKEGDIISLDLGIYYKSFYGDAALTLPVGKVSEEAQKLMRVTEESLGLGIAAAQAGGRVSDIGAAVQGHVERAGFSAVRMFVGHGIGKSLHEEPQIPNYGPGGRGPRLEEGMTLAIEPMINAGRSDVRVLEDGWTAVTADGSLSAHFEHTVAVTREGPKVLTITD